MNIDSLAASISWTSCWGKQIWSWNYPYYFLEHENWQKLVMIHCWFLKIQDAPTPRLQRAVIKDEDPITTHPATSTWNLTKNACLYADLENNKFIFQIPGVSKPTCHPSIHPSMPSPSLRLSGSSRKAKAAASFAMAKFWLESSCGPTSRVERNRVGFVRILRKGWGLRRGVLLFCKKNGGKLLIRRYTCNWIYEQ